MFESYYPSISLIILVFEFLIPKFRLFLSNPKLSDPSQVSHMKPISNYLVC